MNETLLEEAERIYRALRTIPLDVVTRLMEAGYYIEEIEAEWSRKYSHE